MRLDLLAFGAHPDDADIGYGGTLHKMVRKGYRVGIVDLTNGERGTRGTPESRKTELQEAAKILGLAVREGLGIPDTEVRVCREFQVRVAEVIRRFKPRTVLLAPNDGRHPDHTAAERLTFEGCYFAGLKNFDRGLAGLEPHRPFKVLRLHHWRMNSRPSFVVDISDELETKIRAVMAFRSQFQPSEPQEAQTEPPGWLRTGSMDEWLRSRARAYGALIGKPYGEGFVQTEVFEVDDLVTLPVRSM